MKITIYRIFDKNFNFRHTYKCTKLSDLVSKLSYFILLFVHLSWYKKMSTLETFDIYLQLLSRDHTGNNFITYYIILYHIKEIYDSN